MSQVLTIGALQEHDVLFPLGPCGPVDTWLSAPCWRQVIEGFEDRIAEPGAFDHSVNVAGRWRRGLAGREGVAAPVAAERRHPERHLDPGVRWGSAELGRRDLPRRRVPVRGRE